MTERYDAVCYVRELRHKAWFLCKQPSPEEIKARRMSPWGWNRSQITKPLQGFLITPCFYGWKQCRVKHFDWVEAEPGLFIGTMNQLGKDKVAVDAISQRLTEEVKLAALEKFEEEKMNDASMAEKMDAVIQQEYMYAKALMSGVANPFGLPLQTLLAIDMISTTNCKPVEEFKTKFKQALPPQMLAHLGQDPTQIDLPDEIGNDFDAFCDSIMSVISIKHKERNI